MNGEDLEEVIDTLREQAHGLESQYDHQANSAAAKWEASRPELLDTIQALSQTRDLMRKVAELSSCWCKHPACTRAQDQGTGSPCKANRLVLPMSQFTD